jgi:predicted DNA-binding transcriptional regulator YafY
MQARTYGISLLEIQEKYSVSRRTAQRMKDIVMEIFPQVAELQTSGTIKRWGFNGKAVNLTNFTVNDIADLENVKELCKINNMPDKETLLDKIIEAIKISQNTNLYKIETDIEVLMESEGYAVRQGAGFQVDATNLAAIREAVKSMKKLQFEYQAKDYYNTEEKNLAGFRIQKGLKPPKTVVVEPYGILYGERHYLVAKDGGKIKQYLLHKMSGAKVLDEYFDADEKFDLKTWAQESFGVFHDAPVDVKLKFKKEIADDVLKYNFHPTQKISQQKNGAVVVTFKSSGTKSILWNIFKWGTNVEILAPVELKEIYKNYLENILNNL